MRQTLDKQRRSAGGWKRGRASKRCEDLGLRKGEGELQIMQMLDKLAAWARG